jgi:hypothetical protein
MGRIVRKLTSYEKYRRECEVALSKGFVCPYDGKACLRRLNGLDCFIPADKELPEIFPDWYCYRYKGGDLRSE